MSRFQTPTHGLSADLAKRAEKLGRLIGVGLIGSGEMGTDIVTQCGQMQGITVSAIAETNVAKARTAYAIGGRDQASFYTSNKQSDFDAALEAGKSVATEDAQLVCSSEHIDVIVDATGRPAVGAEIGLVAMNLRAVWS